MTHADVVRRFPGLADHTVAEILALQPTAAELDATKLLAAGGGEGLIEFKREDSERLNRLLALLAASGLDFDDDREG